MKKNEVKIGGRYTAKVSDKLTTVRIDRTHKDDGWQATNIATGKTVRIKSAQRLRGPAKAEAASKPATTTTKSPQPTSDARPAVNPTVEIVTGQPIPGTKAAPKPKRTSALDAAAKVLRDTGKPMRAKELIEAMADRGLWSSPNGKTPHATLSAAMQREIVAKGDAARFRKVDRGQFEFCPPGKFN